MQRCIAILALTLTVAVNAGPTFAQEGPMPAGYDVIVWTMGDWDLNDLIIRASLGGQEGSEYSDEDALGIIAAIAIPNLLELESSTADSPKAFAADSGDAVSDFDVCKLYVSLYDHLYTRGFTAEESHRIVLEIMLSDDVNVFAPVRH